TSQPAQSTPTTTNAAPASSDADPAALNAQGFDLMQQKRYDEAIPVLQQATKDCPVSRTDPCAFALFNLGVALRKAGRPDEAIPVLQQRLQNPNQAGKVNAELKK